ncbi:hypothetical protein PISL3812_01291 [Talaromyces islandicus]|uniref:Biogenesis of lysosome-related organelles complex 1 subunit 1 n=1 Tax=Talaromyces islandicus TaxID=28573 RepID=A0A0U1LLW7_TALIS|nr:hypothetical protein PISL3812_01291 [Talaromyces islandicus]
MSHPETSTSTTNIPSPSSASFPAQWSSPSSPPQSSSSSSPPADQDPETARRTLEARTAFTASLHSAGQNVSSDLRARATDLHNNEAAIQKQENELAKHTSNLAKQNEQWDKVVESARQGLKEIGDVQNWAEMIERDLLVVEEVLRLAEGNEEEEGVERREHDIDGHDHDHHDRHDGAFDHSEGEGDLTEREDGAIKGKKASQEPIEILDDMSSAASEMTGTSATSESSSDSSAKHISPPVSSDDEQQQQQEEVNRKSDGEAKQSKGWWGRWW